ARNSGARERCKIGGAADTACGVNLPRPRKPADRRDAREVWPRAAADARERHDDHAIGPCIRLGQQRRGAEEIVTPEIEREYDARIAAEAAHEQAIRLRLAAEHEIPRSG